MRYNSLINALTLPKFQVNRRGIYTITFALGAVPSSGDVEIFISKNQTNAADLAPLYVNQLLTSSRVFTQEAITWTGYMNTTDYFSVGGYTDMDVTLTPNCELTIALVDGAEGPTGQTGPASIWAQQGSNISYGAAASGNVGIGTGAPTAPLHVYGRTDTTAPPLRITNSYNATSRDRDWNVGPDSLGSFTVATTGGIGTYLSWGATAWSATSDARLKHHISPLPASLDALLRLQPVRFQYLSDEPHTVPRSGFLAQDVERVFPRDSSWLVTQSLHTTVTPKGETIQPLAVSAVELVPHLVRGLQELKAEKDAQLTALQEQLQALQAQLQALQAQL